MRALAAAQAGDPGGRRGADVHNGYVIVVGQRLYSLISLPAAQPQTFTLDISPGVSAYDFTFGSSI